MRFITNRYGEIFKHKPLITPFLNSHLKKLNHFDFNFRFKTPNRTFSSALKTSHRSQYQDASNTLVKMESLHLSDSIRNLLYPETDDEIINKLKSCYNLEDLKRIINSNESLSHQQLNQVVLVLRDMQKLHDIRYTFTEDEQKIRQLYNSESFHKLLSLIEANVEKMDATETSCCLLYLNKLNVRCCEPVMKKLIDACENSIFGTDKNLVLQNLSRFFIAIREENNIWSLYTMHFYLPFLIESLDTCDNLDDFRHVTVCLQKCVPLLNSDVMKKYVTKLNIVLRKDDKSSDENEIARTRTILKAIVFLNFKHWNGLYIGEVRRLLAAMKNKLHHLYFAELSLLHNVIYSLQEPFHLSQEIKEITKSWIKTCEKTNTLLPVFELQILFPGIELMANEELKKHLTEFLKLSDYNNRSFRFFVDLFQLIFTTDLKFDRNITRAYWSMIVSFLKTSQKNNDWFLDDIIWCTHKYIHLIGPQPVLRNDFFERSLVSFIIGIIRDEKYTYGPADYSKFYLVILALSHINPYNFVTDAVYRKLLEYLPRLDFYNNLFVSLILNIAYDRFKKRRQDLPKFLHYHVRLNAATNANVLNYLRRESEPLSPDILNTFFFSHILTKGIKTSEIFVELCNRYQHIQSEQLSSKIIRDSILNFTMCDHLIPEFTDSVVEYCIGEKNTMFGSSFANVLNYCFSFGYVPDKIDRFLPLVISTIDRDKDIMLMVVYLQTALALSYFGELPNAWSDYIFNIKFLEKLDKYFARMNFKKNDSIRKKLMELNRVVCIDYPDREIPWFHENYCRELNALESERSNEFLRSVLNVTKSLVKTDEAIDMGHITSYGHKIDLLLYLNKDGKPIKNINYCDPTELRKIALILRSHMPTTYFRGKGHLELFLRQLEMLNFEVITISEQEWNSMYLSTTPEKCNYLRKLIWGE